MHLNISPNTQLILLSGATASGKSDIADELSEHYSGEIINFDTGQFYNCTPSIVAMPSFARGRELYHLYGVFDPSEVLMAPRICELVSAKIREVNSRGKLAILVGCSGMYINALLNGLSVLPTTNPEFRSSIVGVRTHDLYKKLSNLAPKRAEKIASNDRVRIERLLEVIHIVGPGNLDSAFNERVTYQIPNYKIICIRRSRETLYSRINKRVNAWFLDGSYYREVSDLLQNYSFDAEIFKILGLRELTQIGGQFPDNFFQKRDLLQERIKQNTRRYAKRQLTFWRNQPSKSGWKVDYIDL